ncbi:hypothetical protein PIROE2DRAFT_14521 [Piromyces sp. E2]|nr:hypothetical protein PIROE2DRAFT_14521 [Piromyces sp. E2]|eukprot:OUM59855.1 hypothetical protein PIROE2DRAFT_14521 [Piromyces sp. E2]
MVFKYTFEYTFRINIFILIFTINILKISASDPPSPLKNCSDCIGDDVCEDNEFCIDKTSNTIKAVNPSTYAPGSIRYGNSRSPTGNFFFSDGKIISSKSIAAEAVDSYYCNSSGCSALDKTDDLTYINTKASGLDCAYMKITSSKATCANGVANQSYYDSTSKKVINCSSSKCTTTAAVGYYRDYASYEDGENEFIIYCDGSTCTKLDQYSKKTDPTVEFYLNAGLDKSSKPIIFGNKATYSTIAGDTTVAYLDYSTLTGDYYKNLIICSSATKCTSEEHNSGIFLTHSSLAAAGNIQQLIECSSSGCKELEDASIKAYKGGANSFSENLYFIDELSKKLIKCSASPTLACIVYNDSLNKYYLDYSTHSSSELCDSSATLPNYPTYNISVDSDKVSYCAVNIISCDSTSKCKSTLIVNESNYLDGDNPVSI